MEKQEQYAKAKWAETLGVSTSGYYDWLKERDERKAKEDHMRKKVIELFHEEGEGPTVPNGSAAVCAGMGTRPPTGSSSGSWRRKALNQATAGVDSCRSCVTNA
jgi:hypothetical protein